MEQAGNEHIEEPAVVEIEKFIKKKLPASAGRKALYTIYRVPKLLRQANDKGFEPQLLSIGPFHHEKEQLRPMEEKKLEYLQAILFRNPKVELKDYIKEIKKLEVQARSCYSESISLKGDFEFEKMMLLDGCFLVEMFLRIGTKFLKQQLPRFISQEMWLLRFISSDMLLLENQIPFFILERIFSLVVPEQEPGSSIKDLALLCFKVVDLMPLNKGAKAKEKYHHLLDLFHHHCLPHDEADPAIGEQFHPNLEDTLRLTTAEGQFHPDLEDNLRLTTVEEQFLPKIECRPVEELSGGAQRMETGIERQSLGAGRMGARMELSVEEPLLPQVRRGWLRAPHEESSGRTKKSDEYDGLPFQIPSAEVLHDSGIKFKRKEEMPGNFLDIKFEERRAVMKIPYLFVSDNLRFIFQNLIAFEQCYPNAGTFFTGYALFMYHLINTAKDVQILRRSGILEHCLGSDEEFAQHFNQLSQGVLYYAKTTHLYSQRMAINKYCMNPWNLSKDLLREYLRSRWAIVSLAGAHLGLALTIIQTLLSIYSTFFR